MFNLRRFIVRPRTIIAALFMMIGAQAMAQPTIAITSRTNGETVTNLLGTISGWVTSNGAPVGSITFTLRESDLGSETGRYWNGASAWVTSPVQLSASFTSTNWTNTSGVTLPALNSGMSYVITATAVDTLHSSGSASITFSRAMDELVWDPGTNHLGSKLKSNPHTLGGPFIFKMVTQGTSVGGWRSALNVTSGEADLYLSKGTTPTTNSYSYASHLTGSDGWVLPASAFNPSEEWYYLVDAKAGAMWNLVSGEPYVIDLGALPGPTAAATTNVTVGAEGYRFFKTTTPASLPAWELWLGGAQNLIQVKTTSIPVTGLSDHEQMKAMLLVPDYLAGSTTYYIGVPGAPGQSFSLTSKEQPVTDIPFNHTNSNVVVTGFPYTTYRVPVPINQIAWDVSTTPVSGDPNVAARRGKVPNEFNNDAFSEVSGSVQDSFTLVPPGLSDGTFYITVYSSAAHTFNLRNAEPVVTGRAFLGTTVNDAPSRAGWRYYVLTNITQQIGVLGWELELTNQVPGTEIALRRNAVPSRWYGRSEGYLTSQIGYVDFSGTEGFLQRPGHQADIWYIGIYQPGTSLGSFSLTTRALTASLVTFNLGLTNVTNLAEARWTYFRVDVPTNMLGWDARLTNVTSGSPQITVRRDLLPANQGGWTYGSDFPSGLTISPGTDWTGLPYSATGVDETGRLLALGYNNLLQPGTYYVGVYSPAGVANFTFLSRGIGTNYSIGVSNLAFSGTAGKITNTMGLPLREAAYYQVVVPSNSSNWLVRLTPTSGEAMLAVQKDVLPNIATGAFNNSHDSYGKSLRKMGNQLYLLLPTDGSGTLDAQTNFLAVIGRGANPNYPYGQIGTGSATYVLESLGSIAITNLGSGALPLAGSGLLTQHVTLEGGQVKLMKFTVPSGVAAMEVRLLNRSNNPTIALLPGTNAPYPHVPSYGDNYGADGGWFGGRRESTDIMTFANPSPGTWTAAFKAEQAGSDFPDASCDVQIVALAPATLAFDNASTNATGLKSKSWNYFKVTVPQNAAGWDLRLTNVTSGQPVMTIRRDLLPDEAGGPGFTYPDWLSGTQLVPNGDWTGRYYNADESPSPGRLAVMMMGNSLTNGTYYIGIYNNDNVNDAAYTLVSRGVGAGFAIPVKPLNFTGTGSAATNSVGLAQREADYYCLVVPSNAPSWHLRVTPDAGGELLLVANRDLLPNSYGNPYVPFSKQMQKPGREVFASFPIDGDLFITPGTNYLAVVSEGVSPSDASHTGTGAVTYKIESLGPVPVVDLGVLPLAGPPINTHVTLEDAEVKIFSFSTTTLIPSIELRLTNRVENPELSFRPGTNVPVPQVPYFGYPYYGVTGGYYSSILQNSDLVSVANLTNGTYTFTVFSMADNYGIFTNSEADITITPHPPENLTYAGGSSDVSGQSPGTWHYFKVTVPDDTEGWELRLTGSGSGAAQMMVRRESLPDLQAPPASIYATNWPTNSQIYAGEDWTGLDENDGTTASRHYLGFGRNNPLEPGNYFIGVLNSDTTSPVSYHLSSQGVGGSGGIPITVLDFNGTNSPAPLAARALAYYKVEVPANSPSWKLRLDTSEGGESSLVVHKDHVPNSANAVTLSPSRDSGKGLAKAGNEQYVLLPDDGQTNITAGTYYVAVVSEGINPSSNLIGTGSSSFALESHGVLPVTELGTVPPLASGAISNHVTLEGGETKAFHFNVPGGMDWLELRLSNPSGNPAFAERPGPELPVPNVPYYNNSSYGVDGGWYSGLSDGYTYLALIRPPGTNSVTIKAESLAGAFPDASVDLIIRQRVPTALTFSNGMVSGSLADNERVFYQVIVPTNQIGWRLQLSATNGTPTVRVRKDLLPSDAEPAMAFGGPSVVIVPPFLEAGTWYVEVKGGGATDFSLTSNPVITQRPSWVMPAYGQLVTTPGLTGGNSIFADSGLNTNGVPISIDEGTDLGVGDFHFYSFTVPDGNIGLLRAELLAISGNPDMYVRRGGVPTFDHAQYGYYGSGLVDFQLTGNGTEYANWVPLDGRTEQQLGSGIWYVSVRANASNVRYQLKLSVGTMTNLVSGTTLSGQTIAGNDWRYYRIDVPSNAPQSITINWSQQQGDADLYLRDTIPPGEPVNYTIYRTWASDTKNGGPYPAFPTPGSYTLTVPTVRPGAPLYLGFRAANDSTFTVGVNFSPQNIDITNVVAFYGGSKTVTVPAHGIAKFRVPVPADATSWRHSSTHSTDIQLYLDQGTLPDLGIPYSIWSSGGSANSHLIQYLYGWPWIANQQYFFIATNTSATPQSLTLNLDGRNLATDDTDGDGLPDSLELLYFGNLSQDGNGDYDGDGVNNATEIAEGTNPADPNSYRPRLYLATNGPGHIVIEPALPSYAMGQTVTLTAVPDAGQYFSGWNGSTNTSANPLSLVMSSHKNLTANFTGTATPLMFSAPALNGSGHFTATVTGPAGSTLVILGSADLINWTPVDTNAPFNGTYMFEDTGTSGHAVFNYRAQLTP